MECWSFILLFFFKSNLINQMRYCPLPMYTSTKSLLIATIYVFFYCSLSPVDWIGACDTRDKQHWLTVCNKQSVQAYRQLRSCILKGENWIMSSMLQIEWVLNRMMYCHCIHIWKEIEIIHQLYIDSFVLLYLVRSWMILEWWFTSLRCIKISFEYFFLFLPRYQGQQRKLLNNFTWVGT